MQYRIVIHTYCIDILSYQYVLQIPNLLYFIILCYKALEVVQEWNMTIICTNLLESIHKNTWIQMS